MCTLLFVKIIAEFSHIMGRDMQAIYNDVWKTLKQNVLAVAAIGHGNHHVQVAIKKAGQHLSDGMQHTHK